MLAASRADQHVPLCRLDISLYKLSSRLSNESRFPRSSLSFAPMGLAAFLRDYENVGRKSMLHTDMMLRNRVMMKGETAVSTDSVKLFRKGARAYNREVKYTGGLIINTIFGASFVFPALLFPNK